MSRRYIVQSRLVYDRWIEWTDNDGNPLTYASRAEAQAQIDDLVATTRSAYRRGEMSVPYRKADYRVRLATETGTG